MWFMDKFGQLRLKTRDHLCLTWDDKRKLSMSPYCKSEIYEDFEDSPEYQFIFNMEETAIVAAETNGLAIGVKKKSPYGPMKLFPKMTANNPSIYQFYLTSVIYMSESPSSTPSNRPTLSIAPSQIPSQCVDEPDWVVGGESDYAGLSCRAIAVSAVEDLCKKVESIVDSGFYFKRVRDEAFSLYFI